jgi:hypothetical protein
MSELVLGERGEMETRRERAERRAARLSSAFADLLTTLADMYRDEDWRELTDREGLAYTGFSAFVQDRLGGSASNARRYQQGITGLVLPLRELTMEGTHIPVTSADVARLGQSGARAVVDAAPDVLAGIDDCDGQAAALRRLIDSVSSRPSVDEASGESVPPLGALVPSAIPVVPHSEAAYESTKPPPLMVPSDVEAAHDPDSPLADGAGVVAQGWAALAGDQSSVGPSCEAFAAAIAVVLREDPVAVAAAVDVAAHPSLASDAVNAAHRLSRFSRLLQSVASSPGAQT